MTKVYVVQEGSYSDRHVVGVFSTRALAEKDADAYNGDITEYEVDCLVGSEFHACYYADIDFSTGVVETSPPCGPKERVRPGECAIYTRGKFALVASPVSSEHAAKVAVELRQKWLREKEGKACS